jgi:hypothetical protein
MCIVDTDEDRVCDLSGSWGSLLVADVGGDYSTVTDFEL